MKVQFDSPYEDSDYDGDAIWQWANFLITKRETAAESWWERFETSSWFDEDFEFESRYPGIAPPDYDVPNDLWLSYQEELRFKEHRRLHGYDDEAEADQEEERFRYLRRLHGYEDEQVPLRSPESQVVRRNAITSDLPPEASPQDEAWWRSVLSES